MYVVLHIYIYTHAYTYVLYIPTYAFMQYLATMFGLLIVRQDYNMRGPGLFLITWL